MICPQCGKQAQVPRHAEMNVDTYGQTQLVSMDCCGKGVFVSPVRTYKLHSAHGYKEDAWGDKIKETTT